MAHMATDGKKFTNRPPMMQHNRSIERSQGMEQQDVTAQPGGDMQQDGEQEPEMGDRPQMTEHHEDGTHTTTHESGAMKHHASDEELMHHLKKHRGEEEQEMQHDSEPEYE
jgi:hypothetical protein